MRLILLGPPGAGKGTQAYILTEKFSIPHISTGNLLRKAIGEKEPVGMKAQSYIEKGELVPDNLVVEIVRKRIRESDAKKGFILDGFPRTRAQAGQLDDVLCSIDTKIDFVFYFKTTEKNIIERLSGRRVCKDCGFNYHIKNIPPRVSNVCDQCGGMLFYRPDDKVETIENRLKVYNEQTSELISYYKEKGLLKTVSGDLDADKLFMVIKKIVMAAGLL
ncbi:MAG: adenylate kinase [Candidatus Omnitrophota bacterium]